MVIKFELEESLRGAPDEELLEDLRRGAAQLGRATITIAEYQEVGKAHPSTIQRRFGSWFNALELAGLGPSRSKIGIDDEDLFINIKKIWTNLGRQPRYSEIKKPQSDYSAGTYEKRFGSWSQALKRFVEWVNSEIPDDPMSKSNIDNPVPQPNPQEFRANRRTRREITERQRFRILVRDGFRCTSCGASPIYRTGVELHVDHVIPWSKGGETTDDNLQCKCARCNLGKGNAFDS